MYVSSIKIKGRTGKNKEIIQTINGMVDQVKLTKGCLKAMSYQAINDENTFYLVEEWKTLHDVESYMNSKLFAVLLGLKSILVEMPEIKILVEDSDRQVHAQKDEGQPLMVKYDH